MGQGTKQGWDDFLLNLRESMMSNEVLVEAIDGVALITLNAPERRNAFTVPMAEEFIAVLRDIDADRSVAATVLNGAGVDFCSGGDLATLTAVGDEPFSEDSWSPSVRLPPRPSRPYTVVRWVPDSIWLWLRRCVSLRMTRS